MRTPRPLPPLCLLMMIMAPTCSLQTVSMVELCGQTVGGDGMIVRSHAESRKYYFVETGTDCHVTMRAAALKDKIQFQFRFFLVYSLLRMSNGSARASPSQDTRRPPGTHSDPCNAGSYIQFYNGKDLHAEPLGFPLCGKTIPRPVLSTGAYLTLRLVTRGQQPRVDFVGDFTSFRVGFNISECRSEPYFSCHNGKCVPDSLVCDPQNIDNCGDGSDQASGPPANCVSTNRRSGGTERRSYASFLYLYVILGFVVSVALLFWCCWSPGWFIWRVGVCRFIPCCNSFCASCHLCTRSCILQNNVRPCKVTPQDTVPTEPV
ncbi:low-density lipoprotein receptor class A domain-containing protein 2 isoform X4 [Dendrobates tinctorius]|uniref:low-density lipoprotein receptor class A domain-containing protein 2 isoform X4 n=1 Tax=Dendrobates tinctorius TaxID=92724 RepID=UPI003CC931E3